MAARVLIDTNTLVYRYDPRCPNKQSIAAEVLRDGIATGSPELAIVVAVVGSVQIPVRGPEVLQVVPRAAHPYLVTAPTCAQNRQKGISVP